MFLVSQRRISGETYYRQCNRLPESIGRDTQVWYRHPDQGWLTVFNKKNFGIPLDKPRIAVYT